ncbi:histidine phosphatase family protein [Mycobacterium sp. SM3041]|uniref:histidine phosphatase family protein n=1 Tax=Mycobacterium sp. SM3041 TaxID=3114291 RepID=UPI0032049886
MAARRKLTTRASIAIAGAVCALPIVVASNPAQADAPNRAPTVVYIVEHGEPVFSDPTLPLSSNGIQYAKAVAKVLQDIRFNNVYASSALRSKQTVSYTAAARGLAVQQLPNADPSTPSAAAAEPLAQAVSSLPAGSVALVGGNTENIFRIMNLLGIPVVAGCGPDQQCVPCLDKTCFTPNDLSSIWQVTLHPGSPQGTRPAPTVQRIHPETPNTFNPPR